MTSEQRSQSETNVKQQLNSNLVADMLFQLHKQASNESMFLRVSTRVVWLGGIGTVVFVGSIPRPAAIILTVAAMLFAASVFTHRRTLLSRIWALRKHLSKIAGKQEDDLIRLLFERPLRNPWGSHLLMGAMEDVAFMYLFLVVLWLKTMHVANF